MTFPAATLCVRIQPSGSRLEASPQGAIQHQRAAEEQSSALEQQVQKLEADNSSTELQMLQAEMEHLRLSAAADAKSMQDAAEDAAR